METFGQVKVLHVISGLGVGGAEKLLVWAARHYDREKYSLGVLSLMSGGELAQEIREAGVPLVELGQKRGRLTPAGFLMLLKEFRNFRPQILQGHMFHSNILTRFAGLLTDRSTLVLNTIHNEWQSMTRNIIDMSTARLVDGFITFSPQAEDVFSKKGPAGRPIRCIPYGIEIPRRFTGDRSALRVRLGLPLKNFIWIAVGSLTKQKAFDDLIGAFSALVKEKNEVLLLIAGGGEERPLLERMVKEKGIASQVRFLGIRRDVPELLAASDAFVLSSHWEGNPLVVLEAMGASLPVVATKVGMIHTMTVEGETAFLVEPQQSGNLAQAMSRVMVMADKGRSMGVAGRARLEKYYDFCRMQREVEKYYDSLLRINRGSFSTVQRS